MKKIASILMLPVLFVPLSAIETTSTVTTTVDTRDYVVTYTSPFGDLFPSTGTFTTSWRGSAYSSVSPDNIFEGEGDILRFCVGFVGEGISPASGTAATAEIIVTSVNATLTWQWNTAYWMTWSITGQGEVQSFFPAAGGWCNAGQSYLIRALAETDWLFVGWGGSAGGGPETSELNFTATAPGNIVANFSDDADNDGLKNAQESSIGTDPWLTDTDADGFDDKLEYDNAGDPTVSDSWRLTHIQNHPETFGLYTPESVLDLSMNQVGLSIEGGTARLGLQLETSEDLESWTDAGDPLEWTMPVSGDKKFLRVRALD